MPTVIIKKIEEQEFINARELIKNGLFEHAFEVFKFTTMKSPAVQVKIAFCILFLFSFITL